MDIHVYTYTFDRPKRAHSAGVRSTMSSKSISCSWMPSRTLSCVAVSKDMYTCDKGHVSHMNACVMSHILMRKSRQSRTLAPLSEDIYT